LTGAPKVPPILVPACYLLVTRMLFLLLTLHRIHSNERLSGEKSAPSGYPALEMIAPAHVFSLYFR
jgi:hypothetical protein